MSLEAVAKELGWSTSKISRIELAKIAVTPADVRALLGVLDALSEEVETLVSLAGEDRQPGWWRQYAEVLPPWFEGYLSLESEAARLLAYESEVVPGLLQTEQYAAEILRHSPYTVTGRSSQGSRVAPYSAGPARWPRPDIPGCGDQ